MVEFAFYEKEYGGTELTAELFAPYAARAADELARYRRLYRVMGGEREAAMATCAMAEVLHRLDEAEDGARSVSVGTVKCGAGKTPTAADRARALLRACERYLDVYRGTR